MSAVMNQDVGFMERDLIYKIWLSHALDHDHYKIDRAIRYFDSAENIYNTKKFDFKKLAHFGFGAFALNDKNLDRAKRVLDTCNEKGITIISMDNPRYPQRLRQISGHPSVLYVKGELPDIDNSVSITIVGSRECLASSAELAHTIAFELASCGCLIVSGMAEGIDCAAHRGALDANRPTIAVLAGGVDNIYPAANKMLYEFIINSGAVIAEEPPGYKIERFKFPLRNRIMAALSMGTLVVDGSHKSGARHTANYAENYNRDVFAVPHAANSVNGELPNSLIALGAKVTQNSLDILTEYLREYPQLLSTNIIEAPMYKPVPKRIRTKSAKAGSKPKGVQDTEPNTVVKVNIEDTDKFKALNEIEQTIVKYLYGKQAVHIDEIVRDCELTVSAVNSNILMLQMKDFVREGAGKKFSLRV